MVKANISTSIFDASAEIFAERLMSRLADEVNPDEFNSGSENSDVDTDLWELPEVPSKSVVKLSGLVEEHLGAKLPPEFIRPGGYKTVKEAVEHVMEQLRTLCLD